MEMVGLSVSLLSLSISLFIFCYYRSGKCRSYRSTDDMSVVLSYVNERVAHDWAILSTEK